MIALWHMIPIAPKCLAPYACPHIVCTAVAIPNFNFKARNVDQSANLDHKFNKTKISIVTDSITRQEFVADELLGTYGVHTMMP